MVIAGLLLGLATQMDCCQMTTVYRLFSVGVVVMLLSNPQAITGTLEEGEHIASGVESTTEQDTTEGIPVSFVDVASSAGLTSPNVWGGVHQKRYIIEAKGSGLAFFDFDQDGWLDIYVTNGIRFGERYTPGKAPTSHLYKNNHDGTFTDVTAKAGLGRTGWQTGVTVGDYDNDGWDDLFCGFWGRNVLFRNNGNGTFSDVTREAGLLGEKVRWASGCTWLDYDRDGSLDLFVANYAELDLEKIPAPGQNPACIWKGIPVLCGPLGLPGGLNLLYHNNGDGSFSDVSEKAGILSPGPAYSITAASYDFDNDGWADIYVAVDSLPSQLLINKHDGTFEEVGMIAGCAYSEDGSEQAGMGVGVADFNSDGWFDIFKTNFEHDTCNLYQSNKDGSFTDIAVLAGLGINTQYVNWGAGFVDYDNDGWKDIFHVTGHVYPEADKLGIAPLKTPRVLYKNLQGTRFRDVSKASGPAITQRFASRGCAFGDYDNDGDVDVVVLNMNDRLSLLRNDGGNSNNWIRIKLLGTASNRTAIGARVRVVADNHVQMDEVHGGESVMSQSDLRLHFGLGRAEKVDVEVKWPVTGKVEHFRDLAVNRTLTIREGAGIIGGQ